MQQTVERPWRSRVRRWILKRLPRWFVSSTFEIFAALLCFLAGIPLFLFGTVTAGSIEEFLPGPLVRGWGGVLTIAPLLIWVGVFQSSRKTFPDKSLWIRVEALGLTGLAYSAYIYVLSIIAVAGVSGVAASAIVLIFAVTCHVREIELITDLEDFHDGLTKLIVVAP